MSLSITIPTSPPPQPRSPNRGLPPSPTTSSEIEREMTSVRSMRRRSGSQAGQIAGFDPDLPPTHNDLENAATLRMGMGIGGHGNGEQILATSPPLAHRTITNSANSANSAFPEEDDEEEDTSHLFWVPAHLHPELAPGEFRAFLKEHAHAHAQEAAAIKDSDSITSQSTEQPLNSPFNRQASHRSSLSRKKSMLSRQYTPRLNDGVENEKVSVVQDSLRKRSSIYSSPFGGEQDQEVSLMDLQMLEEMADEAAKSDDPSKLRSMLRRSWSINSGHGPDVDGINGANFDESDAPVLAVRTGPSLIRRTARTKIRKAGMEGDAAHRFGPSRRGRTAHLVGDNALNQSESTSPPSSEGDHRTDESQSKSLGEDGSSSQERPMSTSSSDPYAIYNSYDRDSILFTERSVSPDTTSDSHHDRSSTPSPPNIPTIYTHHASSQSSINSEPSTESGTRAYSPEPSQLSPTSPVNANSYFGLGSASQAAPTPVPAPTVTPNQPEPEPHRPIEVERVNSRDSYLSTISSATSISSQGSKEKEKEKKGGFFSKKGDKKKDKSKGSNEKEKGFLSLFGSKKKNHDEPPSPVNAGDGRLAAAALLRTKGPASPSSPNSFSSQTNFSRYPINVERAVYRLSHIKLANPRRPLYEQVLISNLMFWYLSIINKPANPVVSKDKEGDKSGGESGEKGRIEPGSAAAAEKANAPVAKGTPAGNLAKSLMTNSTATPPAGKRTSLVKKEDPKNPNRPTVRSAETPVKTPQYGAQNAQLEKEHRPTSVPADNIHHWDRAPSSSAQQPAPGGPPRGGPPGNGEIRDRERSERGPPPSSPSAPYVAPPVGMGPNGSSVQAQRPLPNLQQPQQHQQQQRPPNVTPPHYEPRGPPPGPHLVRSTSVNQTGPTSPTHNVPHTQHLPPGPQQHPQQHQHPQHLQQQQQPHQLHPQQAPRPGPPINRGPSGPQPGQLFHHPGGGSRPGEPASGLPQIGQVFNHPSYRPAPYRPNGPPPSGPRNPLPPPGQQGPPGQYYPPPNRPGYSGGPPHPPNGPGYPAGLGRPMISTQKPTSPAQQGASPQLGYPQGGPSGPQQTRSYPPAQGAPRPHLQQQGPPPPGGQQRTYYNHPPPQQPPTQRRPTSSELPYADRNR